MTNVMARIKAYFVIICPYCAYMCIMGWRTILPEEVSFSSHEKTIFYFPNTKNGRFCEATTKWIIQNATTKFDKNSIPTYMDNVLTGGSETFLSTSGKTNKFLSNR